MSSPNQSKKEIAPSAAVRWSMSKPNYDTTFAPMLEIDGRSYYLRDSLGEDAPIEVFERIAAVPELLSKSEAMRDMLITCSRFHHPKGTEPLMGVIKSAYRTIVKFRPELASQEAAQ